MTRSAFHFMAQHTGELILIHAKDSNSSAQAIWRREIQGQFLDWLGAGGFRSESDEKYKQDSTNENSGTSAAVLLPHPGTQCEELKFTRVRIRDAVE
ncbi:hypothetical protein GCM10027277_22230 [Pseudoduganella ginsengisoli]|uniref:Uncharacterized protein n=1 Tax=Pseudoduganella ginsengisoli TaxID=1462440 RepID=A0A6L6PTW2_9BURK|nr:hypothetical protein [Pseudoduganella ginsengisoli]MTW00524.1 hypothetical protein [Pseudoduganella ginsengisoli]